MSYTYHLPPMKVVINRRYGGFGLSRKAIRRLMELGWKPSNLEVKYLNKELDDEGYFGYSPQNIDRHDPRLVQVVEELGVEANGDSSKLSVETIHPHYTIHDYDGMESLNEY